MSLRSVFASLVLALALPATNVFGQSLGAFRWQLQPYCNLITVNVTQQGGIFTLDGTDDRCGGGNQAGSAVGIAHVTPLGLVGFGISTVLPNGTPIHTEATIDLSSLNGTWRDSGGNNGSFVFTPGAPVAGPPRPVPSGGLAPASVTSIQIAGNAVTSANIVDATITTSDILDGPRAAFDDSSQTVELTAVDTIIRSITITAPAAGRIIANASGFFLFDAASHDVGRCAITTGTTLDAFVVRLINAAESTVDNAMFEVPFAGTRGFNVAAGTHTLNLVCDRTSGNVRVGHSSLTGIFVANTP